MKLYWVETDDHDEDWFVTAEDEHEACTGFEEFEGYEKGTASLSVTTDWVIAASLNRTADP